MPIGLLRFRGLVTKFTLCEIYDDMYRIIIIIIKTKKGSGVGTNETNYLLKSAEPTLQGCSN